MRGIESERLVIILVFSEGVTRSGFPLAQAIPRDLGGHTRALQELPEGSPRTLGGLRGLLKMPKSEGSAQVALAVARIAATCSSNVG